MTGVYQGRYGGDIDCPYGIARTVVRYLLQDKSPPDVKNVPEFGLKQNEKYLLNFLVLGGSQGSQFLNNVMISSLERLSSIKKRFKVFHVSGFNDYVNVKQCYADAGFDAEVFAFCFDMN